MKVNAFVNSCMKIENITLADVFEILLHVFHLEKEKVLAQPTLELNTQECTKVLKRLTRKEPSAYVAGCITFANTIIRVNEDVLIPRPETEEMVLRIINKGDLNDKTILDLCTGSGCIAIALGKAFPRATIKATDISVAALNLARQSAEDNKVTNVTFRKSNYLASERKPYDLVVCNPPYIPKNAKTQTAFEPPSALFAGKDGLNSYRRIFKKLSKVMKKGGMAVFEIGLKQDKKLRELAWENHLSEPMFVKDMSGKVRFMTFNYPNF